jgi:C_GCAxxG_C_C family probable redox protein
MGKTGLHTHILDISWIHDQDPVKLIKNAQNNGLSNIRSSWPSQQSVFKASLETFKVDLPSDVMRAISGFGGGIAGFGGACGALCGGIAALGYFFGNDKQRDFSQLKKIIDNPSLSPSDKILASEEGLKKVHSPYASLVHLFIDTFGSMNCSDLIRPFYPDIVSRKRFYHCHSIIAATTGFVAEMVLGEVALGKENRCT